MVQGILILQIIFIDNMQHKENDLKKFYNNQQMDGDASDKPRLKIEEGSPEESEVVPIKQEVDLEIFIEQKSPPFLIFAQNQSPNHIQQSFSPSELKILFDFYDQYGTQWSIFQELMPNRNQNQLKNKFYATLRTITRLIIAASGQNHKQDSLLSSSRIPSSIIVDLYQGKKSFKRYRNLMKNILQVIDYDIVKGKDLIEKFKEKMGTQIFVNVYEELKQILTNKKLSNKSQRTHNKSLRSSEVKVKVKKIKEQIPQINPSQQHNKKQKQVNQGSNNVPISMAFRNNQNRVIAAQRDLREIIKNQRQIIQKLDLINELQRTQYMAIQFPQELVENLIKLQRNFLLFLNQR